MTDPTIQLAAHAAESGVPLPTKRLGPPRKTNDVARWERGQCMNGGCTRVGRYRDTGDCYRCWVGVKWNSIVQRVNNVNGRCISYVGTPVGFTRAEFIEWAMGNRPPKTMARPSIDRIVAEHGYVPGNIRWLEMRTNARGAQRDIPSGWWLCKPCGRVLVLSVDNFHRTRCARTGFQSRCKACRSSKENQ